jgi:hypothetical protein|tara:strand:- start:271 stop:504 length:234 start_codon:yes stop_codon:yes gene_type:complete
VCNGSPTIRLLARLSAARLHPLSSRFAPSATAWRADTSTEAILSAMAGVCFRLDASMHDRSQTPELEILSNLIERPC